MLMMFIMLLAWQGSNDGRYQDPFKKTVEATYASSDVRNYAEKLTDRVKSINPILTTIGVTGYAIGIKRQGQFTTSRFGLPGSVSTYQYDYRAQSGQVTFTWHF